MSKIVLNPNKSILENMEHADLNPVVECREGICGACRCKLVSGTVREVKDPLACKLEGEILPCISYAESSIELNVGQTNIKMALAGE